MKRPFDTIIGPDGVWKDDSAAEEECGRDEGAHEPAELNAREEFALRCLNAAANLYGVLTLEEFVSLYNGYAKDHDAPISDAMTVAELDALVDRLHDYFTNRPEPDDLEHLLDGPCDAPEIWFSTWQLKADEPRVIVYHDLTSSDWDEEPTPSKDANAEITRTVADTMASFRKLDLAVLPEDDFLLYEEPMAAEETKESRAFERFVKKAYRLDRAEQELDTLGVQCNARVNGAKVVTALKYIRENCDWEPSDDEAVQRLAQALSPLLDTTRTWEGRGRTPRELADSRLSYAALGHVHNPPEPAVYGATVAAYCGFPEGRGFDEQGYGSVSVVTIDEGRVTDIRRIRVGEHRYLTARADITGAVNDAGAAAAAARSAADIADPASTSLRLAVCGDVAVEYTPDTARIAASLGECGFYSLEVEDDTLPLLGDTSLADDMTVRGELYRTLLPKMREGSAEERRIAADALRIGLRALDGRSILDDGGSN